MAELERIFGGGNVSHRSDDPFPPPKMRSSGRPKEKRSGAHVQAFGGREMFALCVGRGRAPVLSTATWCAETWGYWARVTLSDLAGTACALDAPGPCLADYFLK